jgi:hypothetical protein
MRSTGEIFDDLKKLVEYICGSDKCALGKMNELLDELDGAINKKLKEKTKELDKLAREYIEKRFGNLSRDKDAEIEEVEKRMVNTVQEASEKFVSERLHEKLTDENKEAIAFLVKEALDVSKADVQRDIADSRVEAFNKLYEEIQSLKDDEKLSGSIPLNRDRAKMVVSVLSRLPISRVESYVDEMFNHPDGWSLHFAKEDDVWDVSSATKIKDLTLLDFIKNFRSMVNFSHDSRLAKDSFYQHCQKMFDNFKLDHPEQFPKAD